MKNITALLAGLAWIAGTAMAQSPPAPSVTDAAAPVPPVVYRSVFATTPAGVEQDNIDWRNANAEVGQFRRGHVDILKWEAEQARQKAAAMPGPAASGHMQHGSKP